MSNDVKDLKDLEHEIDHIDVEPDNGEDRGRGAAWIPGIVLIGIGVIFLLNNFTDFRLDNWWALFILIPAFGSLGNFMRARRKDGRISGEARGSLIGSMILFFIAAVFLFSLDWGLVWPFFLIIAGIGALLSSLVE